MFAKAIVCPPAPNFAEGLTTATLGAANYQLALEQHEAYCAALARCGLELTRLEPDLTYPDSTFVEDTAILTERGAVLARPGAASRRGELTSMRRVVANFYPAPFSIQDPGTLDGGDVCQAENHFFIGVSERTNEAGALQLAELLATLGYTSTLVDIRNIDRLLHLKSGLAYLGDKRLVVTKPLEGALNNLMAHSNYKTQPGQLQPAGYDIVGVNAKEGYAANCVRVNDYVLIAAGYPEFAETLTQLGYQTIALEMSEFQKMDGGLSCLSLRFFSINF